MYPHLSFAQKKIKVPINNEHAVIDALAKKYKGVPSIVLRTPNGSVVAEVNVLYNESNLPYAVTFSGKDSVFSLTSSNYDDVPSIEALFESLKNQKLANGFKYSQTLSKYNNEVYVKGNIYTRFVVSHAFGPYFKQGEVDLFSRQDFEISTVDFSRSGGERAAKFDF